MAPVASPVDAVPAPGRHEGRGTVRIPRRLRCRVTPVRLPRGHPRAVLDAGRAGAWSPAGPQNHSGGWLGRFHGFESLYWKTHDEYQPQPLYAQPQFQAATESRRLPLVALPSQDAPS